MSKTAVFDEKMKAILINSSAKRGVEAIFSEDNKSVTLKDLETGHSMTVTADDMEQQKKAITSK